MIKMPQFIILQYLKFKIQMRKDQAYHIQFQIKITGQMSDQQQQVSNEISIEDLQLSLEVYEIQSDQKLQKLKQLFEEKKPLDLRQIFYEQRSSLEVKFQNIIGDLTEFLIKQQVPSTEKLRRTFYRILESPLLLLFKVSRFQIFNLRLNAFDIQLQPIEAIVQLAKLLYKNIQEYVECQKNNKQQYNGSMYRTFEEFLEHAKINLIQDEIFILYSYLRKGSNILKKKVEDRIKVVEIFSKIEEKLIIALLKNQDVKTLKQLSILNYEIYLLENDFDVLYFYLKIPLNNIYRDVFKEAQNLASKAKQTCNFDIFINLMVKFNKQILDKFKFQKIDETFCDYLKILATTLLDLWGCSICQFREFFTFFKMIFGVYPDQKKLLQNCLRHTPTLSQEDVSLIRANYRQNVENKNAELISLLKKISLNEINSELSSIYHQILYNLDFNVLSKDKIVDLFTLVNGNSAIQGFIFSVEKAFKEWNHTIDFNNYGKYIETEFSMPNKIQLQQLLQSIRLFTNLCVLETKGFDKEFKQLVGKRTITKAMTGILKFLLTVEENKIKFIQQNPISQEFILYSFQFLRNTLQANCQQWEYLLLLQAEAIKSINNKQIQAQVQQQICNYVKDNLENYKLSGCIGILKKVYEEKKQKNILSLITDIFMRETLQKRDYTKNFRFFGSNVENMGNNLVSKEQAQFLQRYSCIKGGIIQAKQTSCFKLSELEVITNPIQFQKGMDNYYFTLDSNSKRFIEYLVQEWVKGQNQFDDFFTELILQLVEEYPIAVAVLANIRVQSQKQTSHLRFAEYLVNLLNITQSQKIKHILSTIININTIKYNNGRDYIVDQVIPMVTKRLITLINAGNLAQQSPFKLSISVYEALAHSLQKYQLSEIKIDTIQKILLKINYEIRLCQCQKILAKLSRCLELTIRVFFRKKQIDIKKKGLEQIYNNVIWNEIRTYNRASIGSSQPKNVQSQYPLISEQIMISPFTLSQDYDNQEYKIKKSTRNISTKKTEESQSIRLSQILTKIPIIETQFTSTKSLQSNSLAHPKDIDLGKMKYDLEFYMGRHELLSLENKENWIIKHKDKCKSDNPKTESIEKSVTFVQYYMREMSPPDIGDQIVRKYILSYLKGQIEVSLIWSNPKNLQKIFVPLVILFDFLTENRKKTDKNINLQAELYFWKEIISYTDSNLIQSLKRILKLLSDLGYHNLWGQNYKNFSAVTNLIKIFEVKVIEEESLLSIILKRSLEFNQLIQIKEQLDILFDRIFSTRPSDQTSLMYKVGIDKNLLNLIMKSLEIKNLSNISFLFHSNFNNLRLYTDQLHQGLKALNMASKTRSYNEYIQLSKEIDDDEFMGPMKLFQQNFNFFIKIEREGYKFKKAEQKKLCLQRLSNVLRKYSLEQKQKICQQCDNLIEQYQQEVQKLELSIANRVKSFYLVTKLRDLSYQNALSINLINEILRQKKLGSQQILSNIKKVDIFSLLMILHKQLIRFDDLWDDSQFYQNYNSVDQMFISKQINFCTTRRFSHSISTIYEKCELELDEVIQRSLDQLKLFFSTTEGKIYLEINRSIFYPAFFVKSFILSQEKVHKQLVQKIRASLEKNIPQQPSKTITIKKGQLMTQCINQIRQINRKQFYMQKKITINYQGEPKTLQQFLQTLLALLINNETLVWAKTKDSQFLTFNKYKTSQATLQQIQLLGYLVGYCIYHKISLVKGQKQLLPLHSSIIAALSFNIIEIDDLLTVDFKTWEDLKKVLSIDDSKTLNLNFSYLFENTKTLQNQRIELIDKGASKKVNNLNREQFCDAVACHVIFKNIRTQLSRFIQGIVNIVPKQLLVNHKISQIYPLFYNKQNVFEVIKKYMKKLGIITPQVVLREGKKIQNLRDYQNIQWAADVILSNEKLRQKMWAEETNILILTTIGTKSSLKFSDQTLIIEHFQSKQGIAAALKELG